jgi:small subunit ribosomal protein S27e
MKRSREPIPKVRSSFLLVKCPDCGDERTIFSSTTKDVGCRKCGRKLAESKGGRAVILGQVLKRLD